MLEVLKKSDHATIAADTETTALKHYAGVVVGYCFAARVEGEYFGFYIPVRHADPDDNAFLEPSEIEEILNTVIFSNEKLKKVYHNMKFDINFMKNHGITSINNEDTMLLMFLRNENERNHQLKSLGDKYVDPEASGEADEVRTYFRRNKLANYGQIPVSLLGPYGAKDACITLALWRRFSFFIDREQSRETDGIRFSIYNHERDFAEHVAGMERRGFSFDTEICEALIPPITTAATKLRAHIAQLAGDDFNPDSSPDCDRILRVKLGFDVQGTSARTNKPSWGKTELLRLDNEIGECIACFRNLTHNLSTFSKGLPEWVYEGRIRCSYNQIGARTGRASASEPNLQAIPKRLPRYTKVPDYANDALKLAFSIRKAFRAEDGFSVLSVDESQFELRLLDHYAQDPTMHKAFLEQRDIHTFVASMLNRVDYKELQESVESGDADAKFYRTVAKEINFGTVYGAGPKRLHQTLDEYNVKIAMSEVKQFYWRYFEIFKGIRAFIDKVQATVRRRGYIFNHYGRHKRIPAGKAYVGVNHLIQGVTADMLKDAQIRIERTLLNNAQSYIMMNVHDESLFALHNDEHHLIAPIKTEMEDFDWCRTPIVAEAKIGPSWGELETWKS